MLSPFVTNLLISIAQAEAKLHYEYKRIMDHAESDEQKDAMGANALVHGRTARFFATLAQTRIDQGKHDAPAI